MRNRMLRGAATALVVAALSACAVTPEAPPPPAPELAPATSARVAPPFEGLKTNDAIVELIKAEEGLRLEADRSSAGVWLIGYGHTGDDVTAGRTVTTAEAESLLRADLAVVEGEIKGMVTAPLNGDEFSALVDLAYNIGAGAFRDSTVLRELNAGNRAAAADAFLLWDKVRVGGQLTVSAPLHERRETERRMFLGEGA